MAFDGLAVSCMVHELNDILTNGRVDKVLQPEYDEIILGVRAGGKNRRLVLSASSSNPRVHLTSVQKENPEKAPMFCMLLRKHLMGGKVVGVTQPDFERVVEIHIESHDELGDVSVKRLIIEVMGRVSNIILVDGEGKVLGSIKHIDFSVSQVRQLIPGMMYEMPPSQGKINPITATAQDIEGKLWSYSLGTDKFLLDTFLGIGPLSAREIAYRATGSADTNCQLMTNEQKTKFAEFIKEFFEKIKSGTFSPVLIYKDEEIIKDFSGINITHYENTFIIKECETLNDAVDEYFKIKDFQERMSQKTSSLMKFVETNIQRCQKKLALQQQKMKDCENKEKNKVIGDLLTANLYRINYGDKFIQVEDYYNNMEIVKISLKPELSPAQNAQRYYTIYQKLKNAEIVTAQQMELAKQEIDYLESIKENLMIVENEREINELRDELYQQGYHVKRAEKSKIRKHISKPLQFQLSDGFVAYVGRNNMQNDELTLRQSRSNDLWFHTKYIHGSHTVIKTEGRTPSDDVIVEAAKICAYYSKARNSENVPVDYTIIKNVKKPNGAKPGMVIYDNYNTVNVRPELPDNTEIN